jgi:DNA-binding beta-propeller fold protein YncE
VTAFLCLLLLCVTQLAHASASLLFNGYAQTLSSELSAASITLANPSAVVVDTSGDIFIADTGNSRIVEVNAQGAASVLTISGLTQALSAPTGLAIDGSGNLYVADTGNSRVVMISSSGAGSVIVTGGVTLSAPKGVALDPSGNIFISDTGNNRIVEVTSGGVAAALNILVSSGSSSLNAPRGLSSDPAGNIFFADTGNNRVVKVAAGSTTGVTVSIGSLTPALASPSDVVVDRMGNLLIADTGNNRIAEVDAAGNGMTLLNTSLLQNTTLSAPLGIALDFLGTVYIADTGDSQTVVVNPYLNGDSAAGSAYTSQLNKSVVGFGHITLGSTTATSLILNFSIGSPVSGLGGVNVFTAGAQGLDFQIVSGANTTCSSSSQSGTSCTVEVSFLPTAPGIRNGALVLYDPEMNPVLTLPLYGWGDAPVAALTPNAGTTINTGGVVMSYPFQLALDGASNMYVGNYVQDGVSPKVAKIPAGGGTASVVSTAPITLGTSITGVALDGAGNLFIADYDNNRIVVVTPTGVSSVLSISGLSPALGEPAELAFDSAGDLFIGDFSDNYRYYSRVVEVSSLFVLGSTSRGIGTVLNTGSYTFAAGTITGVTVGPDGAVYIAARISNGSHIVKVTAAGVAGELNPNGISFSNPQGVFADGMGNLYVENSGTTGTSPIVRITSGGVVSTLNLSGLTSLASLSAGFGITTDSYGNLYIPDFYNNRIVFANVSGGALAFPTGTKEGTTDTTNGEYPLTATVTNLGNQPLVFSTNPTYTASFSAYSGDANPCTASTNLAAGMDCDVSLQFTPQSVGNLSAGITVTNNTLNVAGSTQQVSVRGTGTNPGDTTSTSITINPASLVSGQPATITATVLDTTSGHTSTQPTGSVTFTDTVGSTITQLNNGLPVNLSGGTATLMNVVLSGIGSHSITASYGGVSETFLQSSSSPAAASLSLATVTVAGPSTQPVAVTAHQTGSATVTVTAPYTTLSAPSGTLSYSILNSSNSSVASGSANLTVGSSNSTATIPIPSTLAPGSYTISVTYGGDSNYASTSTPTTIQVQVSQIRPTLGWTPGASSITYGTSLNGILDATATYSSTAIPGSFTYTATPSGGSASLVTSSTVLSVGSYTLTANFTPTDTTTYASASTTTSLSVTRATPSITWGTPAAIPYGTTLSGSLNAAASYNSNSVAGTYVYTATSSGGSAATVTSATVLSAGSYTLAVTFTPSDTTDYATATAQVPQSVSQAKPGIALVSSANPVLVTNAVTLTATLTSSAGTPSGSVSFLDGTTLLGSVTLSSGAASYTTSSLAVATHSITAVYSGNANFTAATSSAVSEVVQDYSLSVSGSTGSGNSGGSSSGGSQTVVPGGSATYSLALSPSNGTTFPAPVTLSLSGLPPGATGTITPQTLPAGSSLTNVTLTIQLPQVTASLDRKQLPNRQIPPLLWGILLLPFAGKLRRAGKRLGKGAALLLLLATGAAAVAGLSGCGTANGFFGQQQQSYTVTITATSGTVSRATTVSITVE